MSLRTQAPMFLIHTASQAQIIDQDGSRSPCYQEHRAKWGRKSRKTKQCPYWLRELLLSTLCPTRLFRSCLMGQNVVIWPHCRKCGEAWSLFWEAKVQVPSLRKKRRVGIFLPLPLCLLLGNDQAHHQSWFGFPSGFSVFSFLRMDEN